MPAKKKADTKVDTLACPFCQARMLPEDLADHITASHKQNGPVAAPMAPPPAQLPQPYQQRPGTIPPPQAPDMSQFLNMQKLGGRTLEATIISVDSPTEGRFGMGMNLSIDVPGEARYRLTIKLNSQNHQDLFAKFGANWTGHKIQISPAWTKRGSARMAVVPL